MNNLDKYINLNIEKSWDNCIPLWKKQGRVEDYPRNTRRPKYKPSFEKQLGIYFAKSFKNEYLYVINKLKTVDNVEYLCAFEILEFMCEEFINKFPDDFIQIKYKLPKKIMEEISGDLDANGFIGESIGELFEYKFVLQKD